MAVNGEAIHGSRVWKQCSEGPTKVEEGLFSEGKGSVYTREDFRFTTKGGYLYVFSMEYPKDGVICIKSLSSSQSQDMTKFHGIIKHVCVLGFDEQPEFQVTEQGLVIQTKQVSSKYPVVFKIELA